MAEESTITEDTDTTTEDTSTEEESGSTTTTTDETVSLTKGELDALRKQAAEGQRAKRTAEKAAQQAQSDKAKAEGRYKELAEENEQKAIAAERKLAEREQRDRISATAERLKFASPDIAYRLLDAEDREDDTLAEQALKRLLTEHPELKQAEQRRTGTSIRTQQDQVDEKDPMKGIALQIHQALNGGGT